MSKILFINSVCNGSTGTICKTLYKAAVEAGHECCIAYGRGEAPKGFKTIKIGNKLDIYLHVLKARLFDASGFGSKYATKEFIKKRPAALTGFFLCCIVKNRHSEIFRRK